VIDGYLNKRNRPESNSKQLKSEWNSGRRNNMKNKNNILSQKKKKNNIL